jgi:hypothetical protein
MPKHLSLAVPVCLLASTLLAPVLRAQSSTPEDRLALAKGLYYNPAAAGLSSFHCTVSVDWKDMLQRFGGKTIAADDPSLLYLKAVKLSVDDDLHGNGELHWTDTIAAPAASQAGNAKLKAGLSQMISGFFQSWNPFMNGSLIPSVDKTTTATPEGDGLLVRGGDASTTVDEHFDKNMLMTDMHVVSPALDVDAHPVYNETPKGRIIAQLNSTIHQPPTAPALEVDMAATYTPVSSFQIPTNLTFTVENVGSFKFQLGACTVKTSEKSALKP